jgi:hypothetical protein
VSCGDGGEQLMRRGQLDKPGTPEPHGVGMVNTCRTLPGGQEMTVDLTLELHELSCLAEPGPARQEGVEVASWLLWAAEQRTHQDLSPSLRKHLCCWVVMM